MKKFFSHSAGFTLVELMVSMSVFSLVLVMSMGAITSVLDANQKSQSLRAVMDNLNFTLEGMTRAIRFGENYHCGSSGDLTIPTDCPAGSSSMTVKTSDGAQVTYSLSGSRIARSVNGGTQYFITSNDITIQSLSFRVFGSYPANSGGGPTDLLQPQVIIVVKGYAGELSTRSTFSLETTVSQRKFDFQ